MVTKHSWLCNFLVSIWLYLQIYLTGGVPTITYSDIFNKKTNLAYELEIKCNPSKRKEEVTVDSRLKIACILFVCQLYGTSASHTVLPFDKSQWNNVPRLDWIVPRGFDSRDCMTKAYLCGPLFPQSLGMLISNSEHLMWRQLPA